MVGIENSLCRSDNDNKLGESQKYSRFPYTIRGYTAVHRRREKKNQMVLYYLYEKAHSETLPWLFIRQTVNIRLVYCSSLYYYRKPIYR